VLNHKYQTLAPLTPRPTVYVANHLPSSPYTQAPLSWQSHGTLFFVEPICTGGSPVDPAAISWHKLGRLIDLIVGQRLSELTLRPEDDKSLKSKLEEVYKALSKTSCDFYVQAKHRDGHLSL
jgi:hypothetical protein